jgi:hypothetical protein
VEEFWRKVKLAFDGIWVIVYSTTELHILATMINRRVGATFACLHEKLVLSQIRDQASFFKST